MPILRPAVRRCDEAWRLMQAPMRLIHADKFLALDNNQRIDALYQALAAITRGELAAETVGPHDHDTRYYPRQVIDQSQQGQDLRLAQLEANAASDLERDAKIARLSDAVTALQTAGLPAATPLVPVSNAVDGQVASLERALTAALGHIERLEAALRALAQRQLDDRQFLDALAGAAARDLQRPIEAH
jgi:uncharacterized coiled-coil protein SlyX